MNTRISDKPNDNVIWEIFSYVLAQVLTVLTILFTDYWLVISLVIVAVTGIIFVHSRKIQHSPLFIIPMGYNIFKCEKCIVITNYSMDGLRLAIESNPDGGEARELEEGVFLIRSIFRTAKMLDLQGLSPFLYAHLSFICRFNLQSDIRRQQNIRHDTILKTRLCRGIIKPLFFRLN